MRLATVLSRAQCGIRAPAVEVEVNVAGGLPRTRIVGLAETAVKEARDRVRAALTNSGFRYPDGRVTINLAPADLPKAGGRYDVPIALGVLAASGAVPEASLAGREFIGELGLGGEIRPVHGCLPVAMSAAARGRILVVPTDNGAEAALVSSAQVRSAGHLLELVAWLREQGPLPLVEAAATDPPAAPDLRDVCGQPQARRALEVAATGGHNLLLFGPPGTGKTMLASRLPGILPALEEGEALEAAAVASISHQGLDPARFLQRPFRAPHHTASAVALVGGGNPPMPGEISLAHQGVLFLDELPEFDRRVLEVLRQPLESGEVVISRAARQETFPARFQLIAAMNPCPCGFQGVDQRCQCTDDQVSRYRGRISGPLLDRVDMHLLVPRVRLRELQAQGPGEPSEAIRRRVLAGRKRQTDRQGCVNAWLTGTELQRCAPLGKRESALLDCAAERLGLSSRAGHRVQRLARTVADLAGQPRIDLQHLSEALQYRQLDRDPSSSMA